MTHSLAAMAELLRADPGSCGVVSGVGMHMQKHAYGVWSTDPGAGVVADPAPYVADAAPVAIVGSPTGEAVVATYSVLHGRDGEPERALLICDLPGAGRCYAFLDGGRGSAGGGRGGRADRSAGDVDAEGPGELGRAGLSRDPELRLVGGLDGCRAGWVLATVPARGPVTTGSLAFRVVPDVEEVVGALESGDLAAAAIDIPIGLAAAGPRACDQEARRLLGPRRSSVFPAPVRAVLAARTYADACAISRAACGKALSKQLYNIVEKIREVDHVQSPRLQSQLFEACPELSFALMAGGEPMRHTKRTLEGRAERVAVLRQAFGVDVTLQFDRPPAGAARDDVLDALALAWTARRYVAGSCVRLGGAPTEIDETGLRMEVIA